MTVGSSGERAPVPPRRVGGGAVLASGFWAKRRGSLARSERPRRRGNTSISLIHATLCTLATRHTAWVLVAAARPTVLRLEAHAVELVVEGDVHVLHRLQGWVAVTVQCKEWVDTACAAP